jgi:hypothetical protein
MHKESPAFKFCTFADKTSPDSHLFRVSISWTDSEYTQLKGRIYRQGSKFGDVEIVIPQVYVDLEDKRWSWDKQRLQLIREKRTLADAAVDGIIPSKHIPSWLLGIRFSH